MGERRHTAIQGRHGKIQGLCILVERQRLLRLRIGTRAWLLERLLSLLRKLFSIVYRHLGSLSIVVAFRLVLGSVGGKTLN